MSSGLMYARFSPEQLGRLANDWYEMIELYSGPDEIDFPSVVIPDKSLKLFDFLLADAGVPVRLRGSDEAVISQPDDVEPWLLAEFGEFFEPSIMPPAQVAVIATDLGQHSFDSLVARADPDKMAAAGVALVPDRGRRKDFDKSHYQDLARFFADAAAEGEGAIVFDDA